MMILTELELAAQWKEIDWLTYESILFAMQKKIAAAATKREFDTVRILQNRLVNSAQAKALAVRHVSKIDSYPGIDKVIWETDADKMKAAMTLNSAGYVSQPMRLVKKPPKGGMKGRDLQIPVYFDKAMHVLYSYGLDAISESTADKKSCAFRKGRSQLDVHAFLLKAFKTHNPPRFLVKADIKKCYGSISHDWLLNNIPMDTTVLKQFLKSGHFFGGELFPPDDYGITLGSAISPILANMCLDGLQNVIRNTLHGKTTDIDYSDGNMIRFADDVIVTVRTKENADRVLQAMSDFLAVRGLTLSPTKTRIIDLEDGFDFLSRNYRYADGFVYSTPSQAAVARTETAIIELIENHHGSHKSLIDKLNKKLVGWASYHRVTEAHDTFRKMDLLIKTLLLNHCEQRQPSLPRERILQKYFYKEADGEYVYSLENKPDVRVYRLAKTILIVHQAVSVNKNPYLDEEYFEERTNRRAIANVTGKYKAIWTRQDGKCHRCGKAILTDDARDVVLINPAKRDITKNRAYVHEYCRDVQVEIYDSEYEIDSLFDLHSLLKQMTKERKRTKYQLLMEYFQKCDEPILTLTFAEIEKISERELCPSAYIHPNYWYSTRRGRIADCWLQNGYKIRRLHMDKKKIVLERVEDLGHSVIIPKAYLTGRVPPALKAELKIMFEYFNKKYGV